MRKNAAGWAGFKKVSKDEFLEFINAYPRKLERNLVLFCTPACFEWYDFTLKARGSRSERRFQQRVAFYFDAVYDPNTGCGIDEDYYIRVDCSDRPSILWCFVNAIARFFKRLHKAAKAFIKELKGDMK